jgi:hypothetical protein
MPRIEKSGYKRFWPLRQFTGRGPNGEKHSIEGYRDMVTGKFYAPDKGWDGSPPELPRHEKGVEVPSSKKYVDNYPAIFGHD